MNKELINDCINACKYEINKHIADHNKFYTDDDNLKAYLMIVVDAINRINYDETKYVLVMEALDK